MKRAPNRNSRRGATLITFAMAMAVMVPFVGLLVDGLMLMISKERLSAAVAAGAGAARRSTNPEKAAERFCKANFAEGFLGTHDLKFEIKNGSILARAKAPVYFMRVFRVNSVGIGAAGSFTSTQTIAANPSKDVQTPQDSNQPNGVRSGN